MPLANQDEPPQEVIVVSIPCTAKEMSAVIGAKGMVIDELRQQLRQVIAAHPWRMEMS